MRPRLKAVVLGGRTGLLGQALAQVLKKYGHVVTPVGREDVDVLDADALARFLEPLEPDVVFNAVAYTQVDKAEEDKDAACRLNAALPANLGRLAKRQGFLLAHFSTDFVFDGKNRSTPYQVDDAPNPTSVYGSSKLAGENKLREIDPPRLLILRTAWLFGPGRRNFVKTMLTLAREKDHVRVVHDQIGSPTYTLDLAAYALALVEMDASGLFHLADSGVASWCELAAEAISLAGLHCTVNAIPSQEYPQKAKRPAYSVLDCSKFAKLTGITPRPWVQALRDYVFLELGAPENPA